MASLGAKVLQVRSVELAMVHSVRTFVRSSFDDPDAPSSTAPTIRPARSSATRKKSWKSRSSPASPIRKDEAQISLRRVADKPGVAAAVFGPLAEANINVDMIVQNISEDGTLDRPHLHRADRRLRAVAEGARGGARARSATR